MKAIFIIFFFSLKVSGNSPNTLTGIITDSMCGPRHDMAKDLSEEQCIRMCVKGSSRYALYDGKTLWKLSDQKTLAKFSAKRVKVTGTVDEQKKSIKVAGIEPASE